MAKVYAVLIYKDKISWDVIPKLLIPDVIFVLRLMVIINGCDYDLNKLEQVKEWYQNKFGSPIPEEAFCPIE